MLLFRISDFNPWQLALTTIAAATVAVLAGDKSGRMESTEERPERQLGVSQWQGTDNSLAVLADAAYVDPPDPDRFTFVRIQYDSIGGYGESWYHYEGRDWERWETDFPRGELNLLFRLDQLTSLRVNPQPLAMRLTDPRLYDYPLAFMSDVGWQELSDAEARSLARYLRNGGFLWVDDFWGRAEWDNLVANIERVDPTLQWRPIEPGHPVLTCVYRLEQCPQVPARIFFDPARGNTTDPPGIHRQPAGGWQGLSQVHLMGLYDRAGRLVGIATHNTDIADGWEREGEDREFFLRFSIDAYAMTINIITYAMTH